MASQISVAAAGSDKLPSGTWSLGPLNITWSLKSASEIDVDVSVFGIDVDTLSGTLSATNMKIGDTINILGLITGNLGIEAKYNSPGNDNGLYLEGQLSGPGFSTGPLNFRIVPW